MCIVCVCYVAHTDGGTRPTPGPLTHDLTHVCVAPTSDRGGEMSPCGVPCPPLTYCRGAIGYLGGRGAAFKIITLRATRRFLEATPMKKVTFQ